MAFERFDLSGKTALITGAAGLLGIQHASALLECGAKVVLTDISDETLSRRREELSKLFDFGQMKMHVMDVTQPSEIRKTAELLKSKNIRIDILINNAAIDPKVRDDQGVIETSRLENFSLEQWSTQIAVGLTGAFLCSQTFGTLMASDRKGGVILNIASDLSVISPDQRLYRKDGLSENMQPVKPVSYSVIKTGILGLTRYLATYWADKNVRCNSLSPGGVVNGQGDVFVRRISALIPLGRMAAKHEYKEAVQYLCSEASSYMNGQNIVVDGGRSLW